MIYLDRYDFVLIHFSLPSSIFLLVFITEIDSCISTGRKHLVLFVNRGINTVNSTIKIRLILSMKITIKFYYHCDDERHLILDRKIRYLLFNIPNDLLSPSSFLILFALARQFFRGSQLCISSQMDVLIWLVATRIDCCDIPHL